MKTEKYYYTEKLLEILGGAVSCCKEIRDTPIHCMEHFIFTQKQALMKAQQNQMELLAENILMYMQAVNHPQLDQVRTSTVLVRTSEVVVIHFCFPYIGELHSRAI